MTRILRPQFFLPLVIAVILRVTVIATVDLTADPIKETMEYGDIGINIAQGYGYSIHPLLNTSLNPVPTAYMPPAYSYVVAGSYLLFSKNFLVFILLVNLVISAATVILIGKIMDVLFENERLTYYALWIAALYPPLIMMGVTFGVASFVAFLTTMTLLFIFKSLAAPLKGINTRRDIIMAGLGFGLMWLFRAETPLYMLLTAAGLIVLYKVSISINAAVLLGIPLVVASPWLIRNIVVLERFVPMSSNGGLNFWRGNNEYMYQNARSADDSPIWSSDSLWNELERAAGEPSTYDQQQSLIYSSAALQWISENPIKALVNGIKKAIFFWTIDPYLRRAENIAYSITHVIGVLLSIIGIRRLRSAAVHSSIPTRSLLAISCLWVIGATAVVMLFFPQPRLQLFASASYFPLIVLGADGCIDFLKHKFISHNTKS